MLQDIRDKAQGWIAIVIIIAIGVSFALWGVHRYEGGGAADNSVATVNGIDVSEDSLNTGYNRLRQQQQYNLAANFSDSEALQASLKNQALQAIITSIVLNQAAQHEGYRVGTGLVEAALASLPVFQENGVFSPARFQQILTSQLYTTDQFLSELSNIILLNEVRSGIKDTEFALPQEVLRAISLISQERSFDYVIIPKQRFLAQGIHPTAAQITTYYQTHQQQFAVPEQVSVQYVQISADQFAKNFQPTASQLLQFYSTNPGLYTQPKQWKVAEILITLPANPLPQDTQAAQQALSEVTAQLKAGKDFSELAKQYSSDKTSAAQGGVLPWQSFVQAEPAVQDALNTLTATGAVSKPVKTSKGWLIIKLLGIKPAQLLPFAQVKDKVQTDYIQQQAQQKFSNATDQLANLTYEHPDSLQVAASSLGLKIQSTALFSREGGNDEITKNPRVISAAFSDDVLNQNNNSDVIPLDDNTAIVLRINQHQAASTLPLASVQNQIITILQQQIAGQLAQALGQQILQQVNAQKPLAELAKAQHLTSSTSEYVTRNAANINPAILQAAFQLPRANSNTLSATSVALASGDYAVIVLNGIKITPDPQTGQEQAFQMVTAQSLGSLEYQLYVQNLMKNAKIKYHQTTQDSGD